MSVRAITWAWEQETTSAGERLVLLALADHAGDDGVCFPSTGRLSAKTRIGVSTVRLHIDRLTKRGLIVKLHRRRRPDGTLGTWEYRLALDHRRPIGAGGSSTADGPALVDRRAEPSGSTVRPPKPPRRREPRGAQREFRQYDEVPLTPEELAERYGVQA